MESLGKANYPPNEQAIMDVQKAIERLTTLLALLKKVKEP